MVPRILVLRNRDVLIFDEWDFIPGGIEGVYEELLSHSKLHLVRRLSTPTVPGVGIDAAVKEGCEWEWWWKCPKCGKSQTFSWPDNLIGFFETTECDAENPEYQKRLDQVYIGCRYCGTYLDRNSAAYVEGARWEARRPELAATKASYSVNGMMIAWKTGKELLRRYHALGATSGSGGTRYSAPPTSRPTTG